MEELRSQLKLKEIEKTDNDLKLHNTEKMLRQQMKIVDSSKMLEIQVFSLEDKIKKNSEFYEKDLRILNDEKEELMHALKLRDIEHAGLML